MRLKFAAVAVFFATLSNAYALPPIETYGELPEISQMAISPDGKRFAYMLRSGEAEGLVVFEPTAGVIGGVKIEEGKTRRVFFPTNDHVILQMSTYTNGIGASIDYEYSSAAAYNIDTKNLAYLLKDARGYLRGFGYIIGVREGSNRVFMPAITDATIHQVYSGVSEVNLDTGKGGVAFQSSANAYDWIISPSGVAIAREDFTRDGEFYSIRTQRNGEWESVFSAHAEKPPYNLVGMREDQSALVVYEREEDEGYSKLYEMRFTGELSNPLFDKPESEISKIVMGMNREVLGVALTGKHSGYEFFDAGLTAEAKAIEALLPGSTVTLANWTSDFSKILVYAAGSKLAPAYYQYDRASRRLSKIAGVYKGVNDSDVGEIRSISYTARDGLEIPALITLPPGVDNPTNMPLIVMPHGGPEAFDEVGFNWKAQYFASRGYLIFQPNFRGSGGYGAEFRNAGDGEWGGKMQDDVTDGVMRLIADGLADPKRVCIIGGSYGGYAALAGGAFTPDLYQCVAAIAPVTDVEMTLREVKRETGSKSLTFKYWEKLIGDLKDGKEKLQKISPVNNAAAFKAPVLLLHGEDDTVVPFIQSRRMEAALKAAGKSVTFVKLENEDHWLSISETRLQTLRELDKFVEATIGSKQ